MFFSGRKAIKIAVNYASRQLKYAARSMLKAYGKKINYKKFSSAVNDFWLLCVESL
jgi:hypothetical protein